MELLQQILDGDMAGVLCDLLSSIVRWISDMLWALIG